MEAPRVRHEVRWCYPNGVGGEPAKFYDRSIAEQRLRQAEAIASHARAEIERP